MNSNQKAQRDRLTRIQRLLDRPRKALATLNQSHARSELDELLGAMEHCEATQRDVLAQRPALVAHVHACRDVLLTEHLRPIAAIAGAMKTHTPMLPNLRVPNRHVSDIALLGIAGATALSVAKCPQPFIDESLPLDFVTQLVSATDDLRNACADVAKLNTPLRRATLELKHLCSRGSRLVRVLDALATLRIRGNARLAAEWRDAVRMTPSPGTPAQLES